MKNGILHYGNPKKCLFVIKLDDGNFTVFECYGMDRFKSGDRLSGELDNFGSTVVHNLSTNKRHNVLIQNVGLNESMAIDKANLV